MASVFASRCDQYFRAGDYVRTLTAAERNYSLDVSQLPPPARRMSNSRSSSRPLSRSPTVSGQQSVEENSLQPPRAAVLRHHRALSSPSVSNTGGGPNNSNNNVINNSERSLTAELFHADISSQENWWSSMTAGTWLDEREEVVFVGQIASVDARTRTAEITVWMRGTQCLVDVPRKPLHKASLDRLVKLSYNEFHETCRKRFMHEMAHHLKLRGEGYDESAPFALIAYNNRVISDLINRVDTTAKLSLKDIKVRRPRGPGDLLRAPIPTMVPVEDPLANARVELEALQETGLVQSRRRHNASKLSAKTSDDRAIHGVTRCVSSRCEDRPPLSTTQHNSSSGMSEVAGADATATSTMSGGTTVNNTTAMNTTAGGMSSAARPDSFLESTVGEEKHQVSLQLRIASASLNQPSRLKSRQPLLPDKYYSTTGNINASLGVISQSEGNGTKAFLSEVDLDGYASRYELQCSLVDVQPTTGVMLLRPSRSSEPPFMAKLASVELWRDDAAMNALKAIARATLRVFPRYRDINGLSVCEIFVGNECFIERLLADGLATLTVSVLDEAGSLLSPSIAHIISRDSQPKERLERLRRAQDSAMANRVGLWANIQQQQQPQQQHNLSSPSSTQHAELLVDLPHIVDGRTAEDHLPPLFQAFESGRAFRDILLDKIHAS